MSIIFTAHIWLRITDKHSCRVSKAWAWIAGFAKWPQAPRQHLLLCNVSCLSLLYKDYLCYLLTPLTKKLRRLEKLNRELLLTKMQVLSPYSKPADAQLVKTFRVMYSTVILISLYHICMGRHVQEMLVWRDLLSALVLVKSAVFVRLPCFIFCLSQLWSLYRLEHKDLAHFEDI